ncbi:MAG: AgmX/PglI C-terminal domain-containing protein [Oligoflexia bacterium]|nr:AgmX/PglI C-terminal domain-containing protein [Oligoflexia bacterium]
MHALKIRMPLMVRHTVKGRQVRVHQFRGPERMIGTARGSDIRLLTKGISGVVCMIERRPQGWFIVDLGSQPDVKIDGKPFVEHMITEKCVLQIGENNLEFNLQKKRREIFTDQQDLQGNHKLSVMKWRGRILTTTQNASELIPYKSLDNVEISQFNLPIPKVIEKENFTIDPHLKRPMQGTFLAILLFFVFLIGIPMPKKELEKPKDNVYTRMIFDSKVLNQKRKQLVSHGVKTQTGTGAGNGSLSEGQKGAKAQVNKAVSSLRKAGLQSVISKIASRAAANAKLIAVLAGTPQADASIPSQMGGIAPSSVIDNKQGITGNNKGFKMGAIGTGGKGGGTGGYKAGTGLGTGSVGNGEVGIDDEESIVEGGLDREVIAAVIREHLGQIRYCYERQLSASPDLYGKVKIKFSIDAGGLVDTQSIGQTTLKNAMVEECILRRIATWKFPKPKGGTKVLVSYPFLFKSVQ